jgi:ParB/RepB/Spo0J family partition protein
MADDKKTGAQKRQIKLTDRQPLYSGLIGGPVDNQEASPAANLPNALSPDDDSGLPIFGEELSENPAASNTEVRKPIVSSTEATLETAVATKRSRKIPLALIDDSPYQPRMIYVSSEIDDLAHMFAATGQEDDIEVREKADGRFELIKGHRRTRAARILGWTEISANIVVKDDRAAKLSAMISNEGSVGLSDYERGKLYQEAKDGGYAKTQAELAHIFGTDQVLVSLRMAMLSLPAGIIAMLDANPRLFGASTAQDIRKLLKEFPGEEAVIEKAVQRLANGAKENSVKAWVQQMLKPKAPPEGATITDKAGRTVFKAKFAERELTIQIKDAKVDAKEIEELIVEVLRKRAETLNL